MNPREAIEVLQDDAMKAAPAIVKILDAAKFIAPQFVREEMSELDAVSDAFSRIAKGGG